MPHSFRLPVAALAAVLLAPWPAAAADSTARRPTFSELFGDEVIARGKGVEVRRSQLDEAFVAFQANLAARGQGVPDGQRTLREAQLLERLVVTQLLTNRVTDADRKTAQELADRFVAETKKGSPSDEAFYRQLKAMGMTREQFERRVQEQSLAEAVINREIRSAITITDAQVQDFYKAGTDLIAKTLQADLEKLVRDPASKPKDVAELKERIDEVRKSNLAKLDQSERVKVIHVFLSTRDRKTEEDLSEEQKRIKRQQIEKIRARALAGEDFSKLVLESSEDRGLKETKGEYTFGRNDPFASEFKAAAFSLETGKISDVVTTPFGHHIIKLLQKIPAQKIEFEKVAKDLKDFLTQQEVQKAMPEYFAKLKKDASVEILEAKYRTETSREGVQ